MPTSGARSTTRRSAATPARCPAMRGNPRRVAQRPLPSMMIATCNPSGLLLCIVKFPHAICITFMGAAVGSRQLHEDRPRNRAAPHYIIEVLIYWTELRPFTEGYGTNGALWSSLEFDLGRELYQSIPRVKYMAAVNARKLAIAPTSNALSSSCSIR